LAYSYLFSGLINCHCGGKYRGKMDRNIAKYICGNYNNYRTCKRNSIRESDLQYFVQNYCKYNKIVLSYTSESMKEIINSIDVDKDGNVNIIYNDGNRQIWSNSIIKLI
jgi:hypothetical protein